jgi:hypothetical protein
MKVILAVLTLTLFSSMGFAHSSEMFYQPLKGQTLVEGSLIYRSLDYQLTSSPLLPVQLPDQEFSDLALDLKVEYGFTPVYSGYIGLSYGDGKIEQGGAEQDFSGMGMLHFGGQYQRHADELGRFLGTVDLGIGLEDADGENRVAGQFVLTLGLGYEKHMDRNLFGGHIAYGVIATDYKDDIGTDSDADGNLNLKLYYERSVGESSMGPMIFAGKLAYEKSGANYWQGSYITDADFSSIVAGVYTRIPMSEKFHLLGGLDYRMSVEEPSAFSDGSGFDVRLGGRMIF